MTLHHNLAPCKITSQYGLRVTGYHDRWWQARLLGIQRVQFRSPRTHTEEHNWFHLVEFGALDHQVFSVESDELIIMPFCVTLNNPDFFLQDELLG